MLVETNTQSPEGRKDQPGYGDRWPMSLSYWWMLPVLLIAFMLSLLVLASRTRRRNKNTRGL